MIFTTYLRLTFYEEEMSVRLQIMLEIQIKIN